MSRTKRDTKNVKNFRNLKTSPHQLNKKLVEKNGDKIVSYACDDFKVAALDETFHLRSFPQEDGTITYKCRGEFIANVLPDQIEELRLLWKQSQS